MLRPFLGLRARNCSNLLHMDWSGSVHLRQAVSNGGLTQGWSASQPAEGRAPSACLSPGCLNGRWTRQKATFMANEALVVANEA
eukprot:3189454-Alexandrium_andersonii.AAC.1